MSYELVLYQAFTTATTDHNYHQLDFHLMLPPSKNLLTRSHPDFNELIMCYYRQDNILNPRHPEPTLATFRCYHLQISNHCFYQLNCIPRINMSTDHLCSYLLSRPTRVVMLAHLSSFVI